MFRKIFLIMTLVVFAALVLSGCRPDRDADRPGPAKSCSVEVIQAIR